ncbi:MAG: hypothetical protein HOV81_15210 [Kofleriaceae bacterium]|nr:hypothetical protein [Kofleriaceae bacterium]
MSRLTWAIALLLSSLTLGCTDEPDGTPPSISNLQFAPTTLLAESYNPVTASLTFVDPDADVLDLGVEIELPDGSHQVLPLTDVRNSAGTSEGTIQISLSIAPPAVGTYRFELWLEDAIGHESNHLEATAEAVPF